ncbi:B-4DMT family transporter [Mycobacterium sp. M1]|uniref:B-4DMT family transporter n=1 Tax=Mycolicibacter acidiphilus TaxID=2835306 RepID=A0ABS5RF03_9MYCO|nr:B-4DMT family transporter [Mycolicibacter acidiphilus]MBS9532163.1 B-4DMT family transporter [Mycolicibacter acidiphilus]
MRNWLLRGLVLAVLMIVIRLVQGVLINAFEARAGLISLALMAVFVAAVMVWGLKDGRADAAANPDPDRRRDLAMTWLGAGLFAGVVSGAVSWLIALVDKALYASSLVNEVSTFAAFTAMLVFVPAVGAVTVGRKLVDRQNAKMPQHHHGLAALEAGESTDVFAAVGAPLAVEADAAGEATAAEAAAPATVAAPAPSAGFTTEEIPGDTEEINLATLTAPAEQAPEAADDPGQPAS